MKKKVISIFMAVLMLSAIVSMSVFSAFAEGEKSGTCGENLTWVLDDTGTLTISGTGKMDDYSYFGDSPWYLYTDSIYSVIIDDGVTSIGDKAFSGCQNLKNISVSNNIEYIGESAFSYTEYYNNADNWENGALYLKSDDNSSLYLIYLDESVNSEVIINSKVKVIAEDVFDHTYSIENIIVEKDNPNYTDIDGVLFNKDMTTLIKYPAGNTREKYSIPDGVLNIKQYAFKNSDNLLVIKIPDGVKSIESRAFLRCDNLQAITIPKSLAFICKDSLPYNVVKGINVYYAGSRADWDKISDDTFDAFMHYNNKGTIMLTETSKQIIAYITGALLLAVLVAFIIIITLKNKKSADENIEFASWKDGVKKKTLNSIFILCICTAVLHVTSSALQIRPKLSYTIEQINSNSSYIELILLIVGILCLVAFYMLFAICSKSKKGKYDNLYVYISMSCIVLSKLIGIYGLIQPYIQVFSLIKGRNLILILSVVPDVIFDLLLVVLILLFKNYDKHRNAIKVIAIIYAVVNFISYGFSMISNIALLSTREDVIGNVAYGLLNAIAGILITIIIMIFFVKCVSKKQEIVKSELPEPQIEEPINQSKPEQ